MENSPLNTSATAEDHNPWTTLGATPVYDNPWINLTEYQVLNPNGGRGIYGLVSFKNIAIGVIPVDSEGYTWLVGQYRYPLKRYSWEIPEGGGPVGTHPLDNARRELLEETGLTASHWQEIQRMDLSNSVSDETGIIYLATGLTQGQAAPEETEQLALRRLPLDQAVQMVLDGQITDSLSVAGLLRLQLMRSSGQINL